MLSAVVRAFVWLYALPSYRPALTFTSTTSSSLPCLRFGLAMGQVFSCLASTCGCVGEVLENVCLAIGEIGAVLVRGVFGILIGLLDLLAALSCCWRVPWSQRPTRTMILLPTPPSPSSAVPHQQAKSHLSTIGGKRILHSLFHRSPNTKTDNQVAQANIIATTGEKDNTNSEAV